MKVDLKKIADLLGVKVEAGKVSLDLEIKDAYGNLELKGEVDLVKFARDHLPLQNNITAQTVEAFVEQLVLKYQYPRR